MSTWDNTVFIRCGLTWDETQWSVGFMGDVHEQSWTCTNLRVCSVPIWVSYRNYGCPSACSYSDPYTCHFGSAFPSKTIHQQKSVNHACFFFKGIHPNAIFSREQGLVNIGYFLTYIPGMGSIEVGPLHSHDLRTKGRWRLGRRSAVGSKECIGWYCIWRDGTWRHCMFVESNLECSWLLYRCCICVHVFM